MLRVYKGNCVRAAIAAIWTSIATLRQQKITCTYGALENQNTDDESIQ